MQSVPSICSPLPFDTNLRVARTAVYFVAFGYARVTGFQCTIVNLFWKMPASIPVPHWRSPTNEYCIPVADISEFQCSLNVRQQYNTTSWKAYLSTVQALSVSDTVRLWRQPQKWPRISQPKRTLTSFRRYQSILFHILGLPETDVM